MTRYGSLCLRCARRGRTCCQKTEIYVTLEDVKRIGDTFGRQEFFEYRAPENPAYTDQSDDPVWQARVVTPGRRRVLKRDSRGDCIFLSAGGCRLPLEVRPLICRLHPQLYNHQGFYPGISPDCSLDLLRPGEHIEELILGFDRESAIRWHHMLYAEIQQEEEPSCTSDSRMTCAANTWLPDTAKKRPPSSTATIR